MRKIVFLLLLLAFSAQLFSQQKKSQDNINSPVLQKAMHQRHAANGLFWGGTSLLVVGGMMETKDLFDLRSSYKHDYTAARILVFTGLAAMATSIPFFIAYHHNKKREMSISLVPGEFPRLGKGDIYSGYTSSVKLKIRL